MSDHSSIKQTGPIDMNAQVLKELKREVIANASEVDPIDTEVGEIRPYLNTTTSTRRIYFNINGQLVYATLTFVTSTSTSSSSSTSVTTSSSSSSTSSTSI